MDFSIDADGALSEAEVRQALAEQRKVNEMMKAELEALREYRAKSDTAGMIERKESELIAIESYLFSLTDKIRETMLQNRGSRFGFSVTEYEQFTHQIMALYQEMETLIRIPQEMNDELLILQRKLEKKQSEFKEEKMKISKLMDQMSPAYCTIDGTLRIFIEPRQKVFIKVMQIIRHMFRDSLGTDGFFKQGFFVDRHLSAKVNQFVGWVEYPAGTQQIDGYSEVLEISWDGYELFAAASNHSIDVLDLIKHDKIGKLVGHMGKVNSLAFHSGTLVSGSSDKTVRIWDTRKRELVRIMKGHIDEVNCVDFNCDGKHVASSGRGCSIRVWSVETGECTTVIPTAPDCNVISMRWLGSTIFSGCIDKCIRKLDPRSGAIEVILETQKGEGIRELMLSCDQSMLVGSVESQILVCDWPDMKSATLHRVPQASITCMEMHPWKPNLVAVGCTYEYGMGDSDWVSLFDIGKCEMVGKFWFSNFVNSVRFTPNGLRLAVTTTALSVFDVSKYVESQQKRHSKIPMSLRNHYVDFD